MYDDETDEYVPIEACARRLGISITRVRELVEHRVLKAYFDGGQLLVQPALIAGITTEHR